MKKVLFIGAVGSGKTTLCQKIIGEEVNYRKTQSAEYYSELIDTPGEFLQYRHYQQFLQTLAVDVDNVALVMSVLDSQQVFPPKFAQSFPVPCIGIISKIDLSCREEDINNARYQLMEAGARKIFEVSSINNEGIDNLLNYLITK